MKKRLLSLLLAAIMLASVACSDTTSDDPAAADASASDAPAAEAVETEAETEFLPDNLPSDLDFGAASVHTFGWEEVAITEFFTEELNGDVVNDAVFLRNQTVEERLNVVLEYTLAPGNNANHQAWANSVINTTMAGDGAYDIVAGYSMAGTLLAYNRVLHDLTDLPYLDFDMPWWPESLMDEAVCGGKLYFCSGDISTNMISMLFAMYFNKTVADNHGLGSMYDLVYEGTWTLDKMIELASLCYVDANGDGTRDPMDHFGFITQPVYNDPFFFGSGLSTTAVGDDGLPIISPEFSGEKTQALLTKMVEMYQQPGLYLAGYTVEGYEHARNAFMEDRALFFDTEISYATNYLRDSEASYGILPMPKYDEAQEGYHTAMSFPYTLYGIPTDVKNPEMSAAVLECLASESYRTVSPALFEVALKVKFSSDDDAGRMYDIIRGSANFDFGRLFCANMGYLTYSLFRDAVVNGNTNWASTMKAQSKVLDKYLSKVVEALTAE